MIIRNGMVLKENGTFEKDEILIQNDRLVSQGSSDDTIVDATGLYIITGLMDLHFHGCAGYDFCDGTKEALLAITKYEAENGITTICPATMSLPEDMLTTICETVATYHNEDGSILCGINMEGPFLSKKKKGAQNEDYIIEPDMDLLERLDKISGNRIKIVNIAPEEAGAMEFITKLKGKKIISIAHTTANYDTAMEAFQRGANQVTHLFNAMPPFLHREPGVIGAAFDASESNVELICDGIHLHPSVVRATIKMFGEDRVIFVSDSMMATGLPDGDYALGGQEVKVVGKKAMLVDGTIAGSVTNLMDCMRNAVLNMGIPLAVAVKAAAVNPAKALGIYDQFGSITVGKVANLVLLDQDLKIKMVILKGKKIIEN